MLIRLAWKNIWRNKTRSLVVIVALILGLWAGLFLSGFSKGMTEQRSEDILRNEISHIQVHHPKFGEEFKPKFSLGEHAASLRSMLADDERIESFAFRTIAVGMVATAHSTKGIQFIGIDPKTENQLVHLKENVIEGTYFETKKRNPCLVGKTLANKLKLHLGSKVIGSFQDLEGNIIHTKFKVVGIYETSNYKKDEALMYVKREDLASAIGEAEITHEAAIYVNQRENIDSIKTELIAAMPALLIEDWREISPELDLLAESGDQYLLIFMMVIMAALAFGIINTMLMAILDRTKEIGMLKAIGMSRMKIFSLIMLETLFLVMVGSPLGLLFGYLTIEITGRAGIDLSAFSDGLKSFGYDTLVRPELGSDQYIGVFVMVIIVAFLAALYPSFKALRLKTLEALRKI